MVRFKFLQVAALLALVIASVAVGPQAQATAPCTFDEYTEGLCNISGAINGDGVDLSGHAGAGGSSAGKPGNSKPGSGHKKPSKPPCNQALPESCQQFVVIPPGAPGNAAITIDDLKSFPAAPGTDHMQPNGWMVVGLDTNFYSIVGVEIVDGTLLGQPASVRFTPIAWHWAYGDGHTATKNTPGATWAVQNIPEFDPTPTSHIYTAEGTYYIDLSITFRAEYKYTNGNWTPVVGTITLPANRLKISVGDAKTVLVNRDCTQNPGGPGC